MRNLHIVFHEDRWAVKHEGQARPTSVHDTQREAIEAARATISDEPASLLIHATDGRIRERSTYGHSELTEGALFDDPVQLLNAAPEIRRAFFEDRLDDPADIETAIELTRIFRELLTLMDREEYDEARHRELADELTDLFAEIMPVYQKSVMMQPHTATGRLRIYGATKQIGDLHPVYDMVRIPYGNGETWLWERYFQWAQGPYGPENPPDVGVCEYCGDLFLRGRSDQRYCSKKCRVRKHRQRAETM